MQGKGSSLSSDEVDPFRASPKHPLDVLRHNRHDCTWLPQPLPLLLNSNEEHEFPPSPEPDVEDEYKMEMTSKQILRLLTRWDPLVHYSTWLQLLKMAMNDAATARKMLAMRLYERNILKDIRHILLAADMDKPSRHVETSKQRYNTLCNQLRSITLLGTSYPMIAVLNVVDVLKYWQMTYDGDSTASGSSSQTNENGGMKRIPDIVPLNDDHVVVAPPKFGLQIRSDFCDRLFVLSMYV